MTTTTTYSDLQDAADQGCGRIGRMLRRHGVVDYSVACLGGNIWGVTLPCADGVALVLTVDPDGHLIITRDDAVDTLHDAGAIDDPNAERVISAVRAAMDSPPMYTVVCRDEAGQWSADLIGDVVLFATATAAEACIDEMRGFGPDWADAEYRVVLA